MAKLLSNIILHGLQDRLDIQIHSLNNPYLNEKESLTFIKYANNFILMYHKKNP